VYGALFAAMAESVDTRGFLDCADIDAGVNQCVQLGDTIYLVEDGDATLLSVLQLAYMIGIFVVMRGLTGATPGTLALGIRTVNAEGRPIGIGAGFIRSVA